MNVDKYGHNTGEWNFINLIFEEGDLLFFFSIWVTFPFENLPQPPNKD